MKLLAVVVIAIIVIVMFSGLFLFAAWPMEKKKDYNVVFIVVDALRADHLGMYGYHRNTSPYLDEFSKDAIVFNNAISQGSWTLPSFIAMLASQHSTSIMPQPRIKYEGGLDLTRLALNASLTLPEILHKNNYTTAAFLYQNVLLRRIFIDKFDYYEIENNTNSDNRNLEDNVTKNKLNIEMFSWLERNRHKKFFLIVDYMDVHCPYNHPPEFGIFAEKIDVNVSDYCNINGTLPEELVGHIRNKYDSSILYADYSIDELLGKIRGLGLENDTIIIITSDHGEELAEHNNFLYHADYLYKNVIHSPLIIKIPGHRPARINATVRLIDIAPTILDILDIAIPTEFESSSLLSLIDGKEMGREAISIAGPQLNLTYRGFSVISDGYKYIIYVDNRGEELYYLPEDHGERKNIIAENQDIARKLKEKWILFMQNSRKKSERVWEKIEPFIINTEVPSDKELADKLKALGYI